MFKRLVESGLTDMTIDVFEKNSVLGAGMPYSQEGACDEHITNVSDNEIPDIVTSIKEWIQTVDQALLQRFGIEVEKFHEYKVLPRLLFGAYLADQFAQLELRAQSLGITTRIHAGSLVTDIVDDPQHKTVTVSIDGRREMTFDCIVICTGHRWPRLHEGKIPGYFDAPYPPCKLKLTIDHPVAIKGASLTAIDAIRTLARHNGRFIASEKDQLSYELHPGSQGFRLVIHALDGLLPAIRFHLEDSHLSKDTLLTEAEIARHIADNDGFLSLDFMFDHNFKERLREKEPAFYAQIAPLNLEQFVELMMGMREQEDPFVLFRAEYQEAAQSIRRRESIYWKEMLATLSFALNYPAKYLSAEDMQRLQQVLMPLISIVIAFVPQGSSRELLALHEAGVLELIAVGKESKILPNESGGITYQYNTGDKAATHFKTYVDCTGQPRLSFEDFPFTGLLQAGVVSPAYLTFRSDEAGRKASEQNQQPVSQDERGRYRLHVPGIAINDHFQVVGANGVGNDRIYIMAVPLISGYNPDYSGLDFCEAASAKIMEALN